MVTLLLMNNRYEIELVGDMSWKSQKQTPLLIVSIASGHLSKSAYAGR